MPYGSRMAILQTLTNQGRVVGGHLAGGSVLSGHGGLTVQHPRNPFKRPKLTAETVLEWEELPAGESIAGAVGQVAAKTALPGRLGKAVGAGLGAAMRSGRTVRVDWADGNQSVIELPEKLFTVFSVLLEGRQVVTDASARVESSELLPAQPGVTEKILDLASSVIQRGKQAAPAETAAQPDVVEQITKLAALHEAGILTDEEFAAKKTELLKRL
ncbi:SHOCT domain-containing protein [Kitasatospora sp. NPDC057198]|uniref:SHOCT domain-containing protein n=1 Tax=Kitasatospora sp. NPDC057198 TaxID=3346046 RepID=UPI003643CF25